MRLGRDAAEGVSLLTRTAPSGGTAAPADEPVTVTVARRVAPGREGEFEDWYDGIIGAANRFPGFLGAGVLRPTGVGQDWHVVYRFADQESLQRWETSSERAHWLRRADEFIEERGVQRVSGLETWFAMPGRTAPAPPRWKMAVVTLLALIPLVLLMNVVVLPLIEDWPMVLRTVAFAGIVTSLMTWFVMPRITRLFRHFLYGGR